MPPDPPVDPPPDGPFDDPPHPHAIVTDLAVVTDIARVAAEPAGG